MIAVIQRVLDAEVQINNSEERIYGKVLVNELRMTGVKKRKGRLGYKTSYPIKSLRNNLLNTNIEKIVSKCINDLVINNIVLFFARDRCCLFNI